MRLFQLFPAASLAFSLMHSSCPAAGRGTFEPGDQVLANCHEIFTQGVIKAKIDDGYTLHFPKNSGPLRCPPFRWHSEFVLPFTSVPEYRLKFFGGFKKELVFKTGETVTLRLDTDRRVVGHQATVDIDAKIADISANGAVKLDLLSANPEASATFWQWVGGNYVDLRHKALEYERKKRSD